MSYNALEHNSVEETESTSLVGSNSLGKKVFFSYLQFLASFTHTFFLTSVTNQSDILQVTLSSKK